MSPQELASVKRAEVCHIRHRTANRPNSCSDPAVTNGMRPAIRKYMKMCWR